MIVRRRAHAAPRTFMFERMSNIVVRGQAQFKRSRRALAKPRSARIPRFLLRQTTSIDAGSAPAIRRRRPPDAEQCRTGLAASIALMLYRGGKKKKKNPPGSALPTGGRWSWRARAWPILRRQPDRLERRPMPGLSPHSRLLSRPYQPTALWSPAAPRSKRRCSVGSTFFARPKDLPKWPSDVDGRSSARQPGPLFAFFDEARPLGFPRPLSPAIAALSTTFSESQSRPEGFSSLFASQGPKSPGAGALARVTASRTGAPVARITLPFATGRGSYPALVWRLTPGGGRGRTALPMRRSRCSVPFDGALPSPLSTLDLYRASRPFRSFPRPGQPAPTTMPQSLRSLPRAPLTSPASLEPAAVRRRPRRSRCRRSDPVKGTNRAGGSEIVPAIRPRRRPPSAQRIVPDCRPSGPDPRPAASGSPPPPGLATRYPIPSPHWRCNHRSTDRSPASMCALRPRAAEARRPIGRPAAPARKLLLRAGTLRTPRQAPIRPHAGPQPSNAPAKTCLPAASTVWRRRRGLADLRLASPPKADHPVRRYRPWLGANAHFPCHRPHDGRSAGRPLRRKSRFPLRHANPAASGCRSPAARMRDRCPGNIRV